MRSSVCPHASSGGRSRPGLVEHRLERLLRLRVSRVRGLPGDLKDIADGLPADPAQPGGDHRGVDEAFRRRNHQPTDLLDRHVLIQVMDGHETVRRLGHLAAIVGED